MVIRMPKELSRNYKELYGGYKKLSRTSFIRKKDIEAMNKKQEEMENTLEGIKSRLHEAED